jgi:hypothetical protein
MPVEDRSYLERRVEDELDLAQRATHPAAVKAHYNLLGHYLDQLYAPEDTPDPEAAPER